MIAIQIRLTRPPVAWNSNQSTKRMTASTSNAWIISIPPGKRALGEGSVSLIVSIGADSVCLARNLSGIGHWPPRAAMGLAAIAVAAHDSGGEGGLETSPQSD